MNFLLMRYYVFDGRGRAFRAQAIQYTLSAIGFRGAEYVGFLVIHSGFKADYRLTIVVVLIVSLMLKFGYYRWMFSRR